MRLLSDHKCKAYSPCQTKTIDIVSLNQVTNNESSIRVVNLNCNYVNPVCFAITEQKMLELVSVKEVFLL